MDPGRAAAGPFTECCERGKRGAAGRRRDRCTFHHIVSTPTAHTVNCDSGIVRSWPLRTFRPRLEDARASRAAIVSRVTGLVIAAILVGLSGCAPDGSSLVGGGPPPSSTTSPPAPLIPSPSPVTSSAEGGSGQGQRWASIRTPAPEGLPLVTYWKLVHRAQDYESGIEDSNAEAARLEAKETFLAKCMKEHGFLYFPKIRQAGENEEYAAILASRQRGNLPVPALDDDRSMVTSRGYGLMSPTRELAEKTSSTIPDDNDKYLRSLAPSERKEYDLAMLGTEPDKAAVDPSGPDLSGCMWKAERDYPAPTPAGGGRSVVESFQGLIADMIEFSSFESEEAPPIEADERVVKLNSEWRACMERTGVPVEKLRAAYFTGEASEMDGPRLAFRLAVLTGADGKVAEPDQPVEARSRDQESLIGSGPEIAIALADFDCRESTNYLDRLVSVQLEFEELFVQSHQKEFDQLTAYVEQVDRHPSG